ncbi:MAG: diaminopimelate epimerase, partial [Clostridia bacterium]|nr:diaminopimelate epimerase [Clostridia bacterium]
ETLACGTGACAAVAAAVKMGFCSSEKPVAVKLPGGNLSVAYAENGIVLSGEIEWTFEGEFIY